VGDRASVGQGARVADRASVGQGARVADRASVGEGASVGNRARVGQDASVGQDATVGYRASVGEGASVREGSVMIVSSHDVYGWALTFQDGVPYFSFGCETHELAAWTPAALRRMTEQHGDYADRARDMALAMAKAAWREHRKR
jgi:carbonic anhydrase/acetyltransferase-like protein (isoleucine patch superfamily)